MAQPRSGKWQKVILQHRVIKTTPQHFTCPICNLPFSSQADLTIHEETHRNYVHLCHLCNDLFIKPCSYIVRHMDAHNDYRAHKCEMCLRCFPKIGTLLEHYRAHLIINSCSKLYCPFCRRLFFKLNDLKNHLLVISQQ